MKKFILLLWFLNSFNFVTGQEIPDPYSKIYIKPAAGINIPITNLLTGKITDNLIEYDDNTYYWQIVSGNFFFLKNWGAEFLLQSSHSKNIENRYDTFNLAMQKKYGDNYFVSVNTTPHNVERGRFPTGSIQRIYIGIVNRYEKPKYFFLSKLLFGFTVFETDYFMATTLKEKGTNTVLRLTYTSSGDQISHFTIAPTFTFGYRLTRRILANVDFGYSYYKANFTFNEKIRNTFTQEATTKRIEYKNPIHTLSLGVGFIFELKPAKNKPN